MIDLLKPKKEKYLRRKRRSKKHLCISPDRPRLTVYKSNRYLYVQVIDDLNNKVLCSFSSISKQLDGKKLGKNIESAKEIGKQIALKLKNLNINKVAFDRNGFRYHGKIKALADACRESGIQF